MAFYYLFISILKSHSPFVFAFVFVFTYSFQFPGCSSVRQVGTSSSPSCMQQWWLFCEKKGAKTKHRVHQEHNEKKK